MYRYRSQSEVNIQEAVWYALLFAIPAFVILGAFLQGEARIWCFVVAAGLGVAVLFRQRQTANFTDQRIVSFFGLADMSNWVVVSKSFAAYEFVDLYNAIDSLFRLAKTSHFIETAHHEFLGQILMRSFASEASRLGVKSSRLSFAVDVDEEDFLPEDSLWLMREQEQGELPAIPNLVIRLKYFHYDKRVAVEMAARSSDDTTEFMDRLCECAKQNSIYKNRLISVQFQRILRDQFGETEQAQDVMLTFLPKDEVTSENIVLEDAIEAIVEEAVVDFHQRRQQLTELGVPGTRGILFYGPPGTGKTYTSKFIAHRLQDATAIVAVGSALFHIKSVCALARALQPSLVVLEDVDLVFAERSLNPYTDVLGAFLDELDGFAANESVIFILTTNDVDRLEKAIKDRPGRISQCVYFGPPNDELRGRYFRRFLQSYDATAVDLQKIINETNGVTQVFIKELVHRAVQVATKQDQNGSRLKLLTSDFESALKSLTADAGESGHRIIGFHVAK